MRLNIVTDDELLQNKGDAMVIFNPELGWNKLIIVCPSCGKHSASAGSHKFDEATLSYTPSIVHNTELGGCGWHGWLTNGEFIGV